MGNYESHPAWVCGLKPVGYMGSRGASESHPAWVCGLKLIRMIRVFIEVMSHPAWVCGLKHIYIKMCIDCVGHTLRGCVD